MMIGLQKHIDRRRLIRHIVFWSAWILGFTFIKSFGMPFSIYAGWFVYYIVTLPIFVAHTYLIVYWLIPAYFNSGKYLLFSVFFILLFYGFSVSELLISNKFIIKYFFSGQERDENFLNAKDVLINGLGNFYVVIVFLAARTIRTWYRENEKEKELFRKKLALQVDRTISKVHPKLLIYAINNIEKLADKSPEKATGAIALTSEILNEILIYNGNRYQVIEKEVALIQKLVKLVKIFSNKPPEVEFFLSGDPSRIEFPSLVLFSFVEMIFRQFEKTEIPEVNIEISGFSNMATIQVLLDKSLKLINELKECEAILNQFEQIYPDLVNVVFEHTGYGCSIVIRSVEQQSKTEQCIIGEHV